MVATIHEVIESLVHHGPGRTEAQLAEAIFADQAYQQRVNQDCRWLVGQGRIHRQGNGGPGDPYRYYPTPSDA